MLTGEALALPDGLDPLALYAHLTGGRPDTMLFERPDGPNLLLVDAAARITCRGQDVTVEALGGRGAIVLDGLAEALSEYVEEQGPDVLRLHFPRISSPDAGERLCAPSPFDVLRAATAGGDDDDPFARTVLGVVAFDHVDLLEDLPANQEDLLGFPDLLFWVAETLIVIEPDGRARAIGTQAALAELAAACTRVPPVAAEPAPAGGDPVVDLDDAAYAAVVERAKAHIRAGDVYQIVPSRTFSVPCPDPLAAFAGQRRSDPSPYQFYVAAPDETLFGCSPEAAVRVDEAGTVEVKPIAGTRQRGATVDEDDRLEAELRLDRKEVAEHMMLVDLARNDVARVSAPGTRRVASLLGVERYARVMHLVSTVTGQLRPGHDALHAIQACLNVGTLSGAPKLRATELLRGMERARRGAYGGAVGWLNGVGAMDTGVVIRSALVRDGVAYVRAGAGVVHDSDPFAEAEETRRKASALLSVLTGRAAA